MPFDTIRPAVSNSRESRNVLGSIHISIALSWSAVSPAATRSMNQSMRLRRLQAHLLTQTQKLQKRGFPNAKCSIECPCKNGNHGERGMSEQPESTRVDLAHLQSTADEPQRALASFAEVVTLMMRSHKHRHAFLAELDWLLTPAIATRQFSVAQAQQNDGKVSTPVAAIMWASVSPEVDARLSEARESPRLRPSEWLSGQIPWLIETIGDPRAASMLLKRLVETRFSGTGVKTIVNNNGQYAVQVIGKAGEERKEVAQQSDHTPRAADKSN